MTDTLSNCFTPSQQLSGTLAQAMNYLIAGDRQAGAEKMKAARELLQDALSGCVEISEQLAEIREMTQDDESNQASVSTRYRWNQVEMDEYLQGYLEEWVSGFYFASGRNLGYFNRKLYGIEWTREAPEQIAVPQYDPYEPIPAESPESRPLPQFREYDPYTVKAIESKPMPQQRDYEPYPESMQRPQRQSEIDETETI